MTKDEEIEKLKTQISWLTDRHKQDEARTGEVHHLLTNLHGVSAAEIIMGYVQQITNSQIAYNELAASLTAKTSELASREATIRILNNKIDKIKRAVFGVIAPENPDGT